MRDETYFLDCVGFAAKAFAIFIACAKINIFFLFHSNETRKMTKPEVTIQIQFAH